MAHEITHFHLRVRGMGREEGKRGKERREKAHLGAVGLKVV